MRNILILLGLIFTINCFAQDTYIPYSIRNKSESIFPSESRNIELTVGYLPTSDNRSVKGNIAINNLVLKRLGAYTSVEYDLQTYNYTNTVGGTVRINKYGYLWGGMDLFSSKGLIQADYSISRKEIGIGITPYKISVIRLGWSNSVGFSFSAGLFIPI